MGCGEGGGARQWACCLRGEKLALGDVRVLDPAKWHGEQECPSESNTEASAASGQNQWRATIDKSVWLRAFQK